MRAEAARLAIQDVLRFAGIDGNEDDLPDRTYPNPSQWPTYPTAVPTPIEGGPPRSPGQDSDETLALLLPLLILLTTLLFLLLLFLLFLILLRRNRGISLRDDGGPTNLEREDEIDGEGGLAGVEQRWLEQAGEATKIGYMRAKVWQSQYPPNSHPTDITLSQFLSIQEKGVSAWSFEPDYESNPALIVQSRTEITFLADGVGMAEEEGGGCCVQSNLPLPKLNEVYYWECKMFEKPEGTTVAIGLATKPFPSFRLPGWNKYSVGYFSSDGFKSHSYPFTGQSYGPPLTEGDVLGVGYRPRTGTVFFTRNGKKLEDAYVGMNKHNLFPTVGANSACTVHVNLGQAGFVFIEANVKKWGLAPMMGTLAPPPAYGSERGSILLESAGSSAPTPATATRRAPPRADRHRHRRPPASHPSHPSNHAGAASALSSPTASQPIRPSPLRHSRHASSLSARSSASTSSAVDGSLDSMSDRDDVLNPPTPGLLDISLQSLHRFPQQVGSDEEEERRSASSGSGSGSISEEETSRQARAVEPVAGGTGARNISPPAYHPIDPNMYAPGVAEAVLEDAFSSPSSRAYAPAGFAQFQNGSGFSVGGYEAASEGAGESTAGWFGWLGGGARGAGSGGAGSSGGTR